LFIGARGCLGTILSANLRLSAQPVTQVCLVWGPLHLADLFAFQHKLRQAKTPLAILEAWDAGSWTGNPSESKDQGYVLAVLQGQELAIAEMKTELEQEVGQAGRAADWKFVENLAACDSVVSSSAHLQLVAPSSEFAKLLELMLKHNLHAWQARPGRDRLYLQFADEKASFTARAELAEYAERTQSYLEIAHADDEYEYKVRHLGRAKSASIVLALKKYFDPEAILNPLVSL